MSDDSIKLLLSILGGGGGVMAVLYGVLRKINFDSIGNAIIKTLRAQLATSEQKVKDQTSLTEQFQAERNTLILQVGGMTGELSAIKGHVTVLQEQLDRLSTDMKMYRDENRTLQAAREADRAENRELQDARDNAMAENSRLLQTIVELQKAQSLVVTVSQQ